jgi:hypothetical protein
MNPTLTFITLYPILSIIGFIEKYLMTVYAVEIFIIAISADGTQLTDSFFSLSVVFIETELVTASCFGVVGL